MGGQTGIRDVDRHQRFMALFLASQDDLRAFVGAVVRDWSAVDDIVQETAAVLWRKFDAYDPERPFRAWARGFAVFEIRKHRERARRLPPVLSPEAIAALDAAWDEEPAPANPRVAALGSCLERVAPGARRLLALRYDEGLEIGAIAQRVGRGAEAVGKALQRLRVALGDCVQRALAQEGG